MENQISLSAACPCQACRKSGTCIRYRNYAEAIETKPSFEILNTQKLSLPDEDCPHYLVESQERWAYGFKNLYASMTVEAAHGFWMLTWFGSESTYYRYKRGEYGLNPKDQKRLLKIFQADGANISVGFDRYQDETVYVKP